MAIALRAIGTQIEPAAASTSAVPYPAGLVAGDLLVMFGSVFNATLVTNPAGWTSVYSASSTGNTTTPNLYLGIKYATGSESGTLTVSHTNNVNIFQMLAFSGVDPVTPQDVTAVFVDTGSGGTNTTIIPSITPVTADVALVYAAAHVSTTANATAPTNFTETADRSTGTRLGTMGYRLLTGGPSAQGTTTVNWSGTGRNLGAMLAIRPATHRRVVRMAQQSVHRAAVI